MPSSMRFQSLVLFTLLAGCATDDPGALSEAIDSGTGLRGEYFDNADLTAPVRIWRDPQLDFDWNNGAPEGVTGSDRYSVRWTGFVEALTNETHAFHLFADDGARLWIDDRLVIDAWSGRSGMETTGRIALRAGQRYAIRLEYRELTGRAGVRLAWSTPSRPRQIVPQSRLYPPATVAQDAGVTDAATTDGAVPMTDAAVTDALAPDASTPDAAITDASAPDAAITDVPAAPSDTPSAVCGTWVLQQVSGLSELRSLLQGPLGRALDTPRVRGFSIRVAWKTIDTDFAVLEEGLAAARARGLAYSVRFMAGRHTPERVFTAGSPFYLTNGSEKVPSPFHPDGRPNDVFEREYDAFVRRLANWSRTNDVRLLHLSWYGQDWAELNHGIEVRSLPGYTYDRWLVAHQRLIDIGIAHSDARLTVELPFSGYGPLTDAAMSFANHVVARLGASNSRFFFQANGWGSSGDWGAPNAETESAFDRVFARPVFRGQQAIQPEDYDWRALYQMLANNRATYTEVYTPSFALARRELLVEQIAAFADRCAVQTPSP